MLSGTILTVDGTNGNDAILIAPTSNGLNVQVTLNNQVINNSYALSNVTQIQVNGVAGNDLVTIKSIDKPVTVESDPGTYQLSIVGHPGSNTFEFSTRSDSSMNLTYYVTVNGSDYQYDPTNVQLLTVKGQNANDTFMVDDVPSIPTVIDGAGGVDTLQGPNVNAVWNIKVANGGTLVANGAPDNSFQFGNIESLTGGTADDTFNFGAGKSIGSTIDGGAGSGNDSINFAYTTPVIVNLQTDSATGIGHFQHIESIAGGTAKDTVIGPNQVNDWAISISTTTHLNTVSLDGMNFTNFESLTGGTALDSFQFGDGSMLTGKIDGGAGTNSIDFSQYLTPVTFNLQTSTFSGVNTGTFARIQNVTGTTHAVTDLTGPNANTTWTIKGIDTETVSGILFMNVDSLTGGTKADTFLFSNDTAAITGTLDGQAGVDILKYSLYTGPITVDLTANMATGTGSIANLEGVIGTSNTTDTLIGPNQVNTWTITANNAGNVNGFTFSGIENLTGGANDDTFVMSSGKIFTGHIDGGASMISNTLDYSTYKTSVKVDLGAGTATNIIGTVTNISDVLGGSGDDTLTGDGQSNLLRGNGGKDTIDGGGGNDILVGGPGDDTITGGDGRDLIMGGLGSDKLSGGGGEDILINGTTTFDTDGATQNAILNFWIMDSVTTTITNPDGSTTIVTTPLPFATRVSELRAGTTGNTAIPALNATNVLNDTSTDMLTGGSITPTDDNLDWFFAKLSGSAQDTITDLAGGEALN